MRHILLNLFIVFAIILGLASYSYSRDNFSLYGVSIGDSYDEVKENGIKRGYKVTEGDYGGDNLTRYMFRWLYLFNKDLDEKLSNIKDPFLYSKFMRDYFKENVLALSYRDKEKLVDVDIYFIKTYESVNPQLNVFLIRSNLNIEKIIEIFNKRYGNSTLIEDRNHLWKEGDIVALSGADTDGTFFLANLSEIIEMFEINYNDYIVEMKEKERQAKELQKKRDEEI